MDWTTEIAAAATRIAPHIQRTPVLKTRGFGLDFPVEMKLEQLQHTGSFKPRGAFNTLLSNDVPEAGVVAASGGNHGAAVAFAASTLGHRARIFVPELSGPAKIALIERMGAELSVVENFEQTLALTAEYAAKTGAMQIHPYDAPATVVGQGTLFAEWEDQGLDADTLLIAVGGGGLVSGAIGWFAGRKKIVAVETDLTGTLANALANGPESEIEPRGIAASALGGRKIGAICWEMVARHPVTSITVPDAAVAAARKVLWRERRLLVEPGGATALAALTSGAYRPAPGENVAVLVCGANVAPDPFEQTA